MGGYKPDGDPRPAPVNKFFNYIKEIEIIANKFSFKPFAPDFVRNPIVFPFERKVGRQAGRF